MQLIVTAGYQNWLDSGIIEDSDTKLGKKSNQQNHEKKIRTEEDVDDLFIQLEPFVLMQKMTVVLMPQKMRWRCIHLLGNGSTRQLVN